MLIAAHSNKKLPAPALLRTVRPGQCHSVQGDIYFLASDRHRELPENFNWNIGFRCTVAGKAAIRFHFLILHNAAALSLEESWNFHPSAWVINDCDTFLNLLMMSRLWITK